LAGFGALWQGWAGEPGRGEGREVDVKQRAKRVGCARLALGFVLQFWSWLHLVAWGCRRLHGLGSFCAGVVLGWQVWADCGRSMRVAR
jgi:hypothetical protein